MLARICLNLSHYSSLSSIAPGRFSKLHPVSVQSSCRLVLVRLPTVARPCEEVHRRTSLMSSSLLLQQCPAYYVCLILMVLEIGGKWPYSCYFVECCFKNLYKIARSILVQFLSSFFSIRYTIINSFCVFLSFWALALVGLLLLYRDVVFALSRFFLTANIFRGTLCLGLSLVGMHSAAASMWVLAKFLYSSFGVSVSDISWRASNLFFLVLSYIHCWVTTSHSVLFWLFISYSSLAQTYLCCDYSVIRRYSFKRGVYFTVQCAMNPFLIHEDVIYLCFSIICVGGGPYFPLPFLEFNIKACKSVFQWEFC